MAIISRALYLVALFFFLHSAYSSYEYHQLNKHFTRKPPISAQRLHIPKDIVYELVVGFCIYILAIFTSFSKLTYLPLHFEGDKSKPITLNQYLLDTELSLSNKVDSMIGKNAYGEIQNTPHFLNIEDKRKQIAEWLTKSSEKKKI